MHSPMQFASLGLVFSLWNLVPEAVIDCPDWRSDFLGFPILGRARFHKVVHKGKTCNPAVDGRSIKNFGVSSFSDHISTLGDKIPIHHEFTLMKAKSWVNPRQLLSHALARHFKNYEKALLILLGTEYRHSTNRKFYQYFIFLILNICIFFMTIQTVF